MSIELKLRLRRISQSMKRVIAPNANWSQYAYEAKVREYIDKARWLELGCGNRIVRDKLSKTDSEFVAKSSYVVGIDPDYISLKQHKLIMHRVLGIGETLPFKSGSFDLVTSSMVFEHIKYPFEVFQEIARVLSPGGTAIIHTPNRIGYDTLAANMLPFSIRQKLATFLFDSVEDDIYPTYYRANQYKDIEQLSKQAGFNNVEIDYLCSVPITYAIPPIVFFELLWLRALDWKILSRFRPIILATLKT